MNLVRKRVYDLLNSNGERIGTIECESDAIMKVYKDQANAFVACNCLFLGEHRQFEQDIAFFFTKEDLQEALESGDIVIENDTAIL